MNCIRGATDVTVVAFDPTKKIALIFGENGTGKSSIVDAIDLVCNESIGSLQDRSLDGSPRGSHLKSIGKSPRDLSVVVESGGQIWVGSLKGNSPSSEGPSPKPTAHVLRRSKLST